MAKKATTAPAKKTTAKSSSKKVSTKKNDKAEKSFNKTSFSVITFGVSLLLLVLFCIPGQSAWAFLREKVLFGVFGLFSILLVLLLMFIAVMAAKDKIGEKKTKWQIVGWSFLILFLNSFLHIVTNSKMTSRRSAILFSFHLFYPLPP